MFESLHSDQPKSPRKRAFFISAHRFFRGRRAINFPCEYYLLHLCDVRTIPKGSWCCYKGGLPGGIILIEIAMPLSKIVPVEILPEKTAIAAYELVAKALREQTAELNITLSNVTDDGNLVGSFEISIRKIDEKDLDCARGDQQTIIVPPLPTR
ncbi:hypothetical protein [Rhizobium sp. BK376]|uniref:hypothetical protein n=1 Tax=Rhizobium sp. BK376 TaxID=2512149 RepID=UPI00104B9C69|nr:hypothetical protein [Rhizobium sp. BK376]